MDWSRDFYPFGEEINASGAGNEYKFTGKEWDEESGLYYSWHRYYSPVLGRFTQVDPLWQKYPGLAPYQYCDNNPLINTDPDGEFFQAVIGFVVGAALEAGSQVVESMHNGQTFSEACSSIDKSDVMIAAGAGAITGGLSAVNAVSTAVKIAKVGVSVATNIGEGAVKAGTGSNTEQYGIGDALVDGTLGAAGELGGILGKKAAQASNTQTLKTLKNDARKAANTAAKGRPRPAQTASAVATQKKVDNYGSGVIATSASQTAQGAAKTIINTEKSKKD
ncbi:MAG: RHS repeat-associated core domain-containing protein [Dehalococcoidales bacterium]|nr:RHS repeat-associated core domain-containing protein [Dehalococcoidales bacterium]